MPLNSSDKPEGKIILIRASDVDMYAAAEELRKLIHIKGRSIVIDAGYRYAIELSQCATPPKILAWAAHLATKPWMSGRMLKRFIELTTKHHGLQLPQL